MRPLPPHPCLYQINTRAFLHGLGPSATLDNVPDAFLDGLAERGFDLVWFLGVWQTGTAGRAVSLSRTDWRAGFQRELPDLTEEDIVGSPFAVRSYTLHEDFGGPDSLARLRERLHERGMRLLLDFVPNHVALDHPWVQTHPDFLVHGSEEDLAREPGNYRRMHTGAGVAILALGRDPYFPGWPDSLQLDHSNPALRAALSEELERIAGCCDGLRCDMSMLLLPEVFRRTWGRTMDASFWPDAIARVKGRYPDLVLIAEVYWDLEWTMMQQGFDFTYDKRLYDRLRDGNAHGVRQHLQADLAFQARCVRFLENHDEPRAPEAFGDKHHAAAVLTFLAPGLRFFHEGQLEGRRVQHSIHLRRRRPEPPDPGTQDFYRALLETLRRPEIHSGTWRLLPTGEEGLFVYQWEGPGRLLAVVNYTSSRRTCEVEGRKMELPGWGYRVWDGFGRMKDEG
jgi:glycosidase